MLAEPQYGERAAMIPNFPPLIKWTAIRLLIWNRLTGGRSGARWWRRKLIVCNRQIESISLQSIAGPGIIFITSCIHRNDTMSRFLLYFVFIRAADPLPATFGASKSRQKPGQEKANRNFTRWHSDATEDRSRVIVSFSEFAKRRLALSRLQFGLETKVARKCAPRVLEFDLLSRAGAQRRRRARMAAMSSGDEG